MWIRFHQTCESEHPDFPFMAGQVISVPAPSPLLRQHLDCGRAEALRTDDAERAVEIDAEIPEPARKRGRKRVAR